VADGGRSYELTFEAGAEEDSAPPTQVGFTLEIRYSDVRSVYKTKSSRCQNSDTRL
jgi:hypothetical protein